MGTTVALTGASGFVGRAVAQRLLAGRYAVRALSRRADPDLEEAGVEAERGALEDQSSLERLVAGVDIVVHCAGALKASDNRAFAAVNTEGTVRLVNVAAAAPQRPRFLLISSLAARQPAVSAYAASKRGAEETLRRGDTNLDWCIVRPPGVYGPGDRATLPLFRQLERGLLLSPAVRGARFSLLHVHDLAGAIERLLSRPRWDGAVLEVDDGRHGGYGWSDLADAASRHLGRRVRRIAVPYGVLRLPAALNQHLARARGQPSIFTPGKLRELYHPDWVARSSPGPLLADLQAEFAFETGFPNTLEWYRRRGWM
jgi:nucleoside-diphosphate-sugar epimerase